MKELITALVSAQSEFPPIPKNKNNPFHKSKYADLDSILEIVTPILCKHDLAIVQMVETNLNFSYSYSDSKEETKAAIRDQPEINKRETVDLTHPGILLRTRLYHTSGDFIESTYPLVFDPNPQKRGSDVTYARRYALCALLSITADTDDDGNAASQRPTGSQSRPASNPGKPANPPASLQEQSSALFKQLGWDQAKCIQYLEATFNGITNRKTLGEMQHKELITNLKQILEHQNNG